MKKTLIILSLVALLATAAQAVDISSSFVNIDFDSGAVSNPFDGFDAPWSPEIIGWSNYRNGAAGILNDSGVEATGGWWNGGGSNACFMSTDDAAYNLSSYVIQAGEAYSLSFSAKGWGGSGQWTVSLFYNTPANTIGSFTVTPGNWNWITVSSPTPILATPASVGGTLGVLFKSTGVNVSCLDELIIATVPLSNNSPANGATLIPIGRTNAANDLVFTIHNQSIVKVDVQFGTENDPNLTTKPAYKIVDDLAVSAGTQYTVNLETLAADLEYSTTYYWKVIGYEPNGVNFTAIPGSVSAFTTIPATPIFSPNPGHAGTIENGSASLTAVATSVLAYPAGTVIKWYKEAGATDVEITTGITETRNLDNTEVTSTMTISTVTLAEEGLYYATATNTGGTTTSTNGSIVITRMLAQYLFENNTNDSSPSGLNGTNQTPSGTVLDPNFVAGIAPATGNALVFNGLGDSNITNTTGNYVDLPDGFSDFSQGITIAAWVYCDAVSAWQRIAQFGNGTNGGSNSIYFTRNNTTSQIRMEVDNTNPDGSYSITSGDNGFTPNEWQLLVATINTDATDNARIYRNGVVVASGNITLPNVITRTNCFIGRSEWYGDYLFKGNMDDVRIYNYALTANDVGDLYVPVNGAFCQVKPIYDFDDDCDVDLADFTMFAATWLECGIYPSCN